MKIAIINGSPKIKDSASDCILQELKVFLSKQDNTIIEYHFRKPQLSIKEIRSLAREVFLGDSQLICNELLIFITKIIYSDFYW